jgi:hypothetical protein
MVCSLRTVTDREKREGKPALPTTENAILIIANYPLCREQPHVFWDFPG